MKDDSKNETTCQTVVYFDVYVIWCRCTNQFYVGTTSQRVTTRIDQHKRGKRQFLDKEIKRIGWEGNWDYWIVEENMPSEQISECEKKWIKLFDCVHPKGYNRTTGGMGNFKASKETCEKIKQSRLGKKRAPFTEEHKANLSKSRMGEKNPFFGKHHTEESKEKNRQAHLGKSLTEEHKTKIGAAGRGRKASEKTRAILREKALARHAAKRVAKAVAKENLAAANSTPTSLATLSDAVILQQSLRSQISFA